MALATFKEQFDNSYQAIFSKVNVYEDIANSRLEKMLTYGASVKRPILTISGIRIRDITLTSDRTIDEITDSSETLTINYNKGVDFYVYDKDKIQAGPLSPGSYAGTEVAKNVANMVDAYFFAQVPNALYALDNGDLATRVSDGTPITLSTTTLPQLLAQGRAKLKSRNQTLTNLKFVTDSYAMSIAEQYLMGKNIDIAAATFKNGYAGPMGGADTYVSENLTGTAVLSIATQPTDGDTVTINGVVFTFKTTLGSTAGNVAIAGSADAARLNLSELINAPGTTDAGQVALSAANQLLFTDTYRFTATDDAAANTLTLVGIGSGRITASETLTDATDAWTKNYINCYYGQKGGIDLVIQDWVEWETLRSEHRRADIYRGDVIFGLKTFADGAKRFLNVKIAS